MTIWQQYCVDNHRAIEFTCLETYVGRKVRHIIYSPGILQETIETWSETIHVITEFNDNLCGSAGCCVGFTISDSDLNWASHQLQVVT